MTMLDADLGTHHAAPVISGVVPRLAVKAGHWPRTETGIGALMPWADRLWFVTYVSHGPTAGTGTGLFSIDDDLVGHQHPASVVGTYANRFIHSATSQLFIGPHVIDEAGEVRTIGDLIGVRLAATCGHLTDPDSKLYMLGMEGEFLEVDARTLRVTPVADLCRELEIPGRPHFKDAWTGNDRVVVVNNSYFPADFSRGESDGRLAEWDGTRWTVLNRTQFNTVASANGMGEALFAVGQDRASTILRVHLPRTGWRTYRLPKATHTQDHAFTTEWPRIREVESERLLMDAGGMFYELPPMTYDDAVWGIRPIASHLRVIGDFCSWNGLLVMAGDQTTPLRDVNPVAGQPQANLWFGKTDDLWSWGPTQGWGGPWWESMVTADAPSDPYLMTGFSHTCLHLSHDADQSVDFDIEVDFMGTGQWRHLRTITVPTSGYVPHVFEPGFSAHWLRLIPRRSCTATAQLVHT